MGKGEGLNVYLCSNCSWSDFFETKTCPRCQNEIKEVSLSGKGKIATFTVVRYPPAGFEQEGPYIVALVDLEDGPRVIGRIKANLDGLQTSQAVRYVGKADGALRFEA